MDIDIDTPDHKKIRHFIRADTGYFTSWCGKCGCNHPQANCPAYKRKCHNCGQKGNFTSLCKGRGSRRQFRDGKYGSSSSRSGNRQSHPQWVTGCKKRFPPLTDTIVRRAFTLTHLSYILKKTSTPYTKSHLKEMKNTQYSLMTLTMIWIFPSFLSGMMTQPTQIMNQILHVSHTIPALQNLKIIILQETKARQHPESPFQDHQLKSAWKTATFQDHMHQIVH